MIDAIHPDDPNLVTFGFPAEFKGKPTDADILDDEPSTEEEWLSIMAEPPGPSLRELIDEFELNSMAGLNR